ncbi:ral guanine nucleotide dissociation stimulator-like [Tamandua tetradactyla]|uniref:ral guanine nucleotide dissociation stimulator-like n=1 Tax=Tamandua tetradactyla TaxID=48850 RepID=UPI0040545076
MDVELFRKVVPYHCLGSIWSQRDKKGKEHLAPTIRATVTQFNRVANCVITTCLGDRSTKALDRARVVEHWIEVARECRILKNFSSLYAVLSALQSNSIHRLKKTWEEVSRCAGLSPEDAGWTTPLGGGVWPGSLSFPSDFKWSDVEQDRGHQGRYARGSRMAPSWMLPTPPRLLSARLLCWEPALISAAPCVRLGPAPRQTAGLDL